MLINTVVKPHSFTVKSTVMKNTYLLLVALFMALSAWAQPLLPKNNLHGRMAQRPDRAGINPSAVKHNGNRTTSSGGSWYGYKAYMDTVVALGAVAATSVELIAPYLWNDTASKDAYTTGIFHNTMVSYGYIYNPVFPGFHTHLGLPVITAADAYTVDSLTLYGIYGINPAKTGVVDTLKVGYVFGTASFDGDDIEVDSEYCSYCKYDSAENIGMGTTFHEQILTISTGPSSNTNINWGDTLSNGVMYHPFGFDVPAAVPAGNLLGITVSFKSGDPSFAFGDIVYTAAGTYNYNMFRPLVAYYYDSVSSVVGPFADSSDMNCGQFKTLPSFENGWQYYYVPMWAWTSGGGTSMYQYPVMDMHAYPGLPLPLGTASTAIVMQAHAMPNPANNATAIVFRLDAPSNVNVTFMDATGQLVAAQQFDNVNSGSAVINTANFAPGIYFYSVTTNNRRMTGNVVVAH